MPPDPVTGTATPGTPTPKITDAATLRALDSLCPGGVQRGVSLARHSRWRIGGTADLVIRPAGRGECAALVRFLSESGLPFVTIGSTSNLLFADEGLRAVCIQVGARMAHTAMADDASDPDIRLVRCGGGRWVPGLARALAQAGLSGAEHICGIPGSLGGLVCMNGGSLRRAIGDSVRDVTSVDRRGRVRTRAREECGFAYRASIFQSAGEIITDVTLALPCRAASPGAIRRAMLDILQQRRRKFPRDLPHCGSVFVSDPAAHAAWGTPGAMIERCGLKGTTQGGAEISPQHANFIVNRGGATAADILSLLRLAQDRVAAATGHVLKPEIRYVTPDGLIVPADDDAVPLPARGQTP